LVVSRRRVLEAAFILLEFLSPSRRIFIGSHSLPPSLVRRIGPSPPRPSAPAAYPRPPPSVATPSSSRPATAPRLQPRLVEPCSQPPPHPQFPTTPLDERRLVGTAASDLNTLAGARGAWSASPCEHKDKKVRPPQLEHTTPRRTISHLREEKPRFLFLEDSAGAVGAAGAAAAAPPDASAARAHLRGPRCLCCRPPGGGRPCARPRRPLSRHRSRLR
jgi:hypothetical protein